MGRTKASGSLLAEEYGRILSFFDEHGPRTVQEVMGVPHKEDKLPQGPVLGMNETPHCTFLHVVTVCPIHALDR